ERPPARSPRDRAGGLCAAPALLEGHALAHGLDPRTAPANSAVLPYMEYAFGVWYVRGGGLRELARAVYERCLARRVEFRFETEVTGIVEKDGRVAGVELAEGALAEAEFVVSGVAPGVLDRLRGGAPVRGEDEVPAQRGGASRLTVLLALRGGRPAGTAHRTVVHAADREAELDSLFGAAPGMAARPTVTVLRPDDPALVPDADHEAVTLSAVVPALQGESDRDPSEESGRRAEHLIDVAERAVPGLRDRLLWHEVRTPAEVAADTGAPDGVIPVPAFAGAGGRLLHPANGTRTEGLFTVGGWSHPGGGLPHAGMSGALVAGLVVEGPEFRGSQ
ncbi:phytoene desaturase family protein, partial [Streptomyces tendae]